MKTNFCVLSTIFTIIIFALNQTSSAQSDNFDTYTNKDLGFSIQHPSIWMVEEDAKQVLFTIRENKEEKKVNEYFTLPAGLFDPYFQVTFEEPKTDLDTDTMTLKNTSLAERAQQELDTIALNSDTEALIRQNPVTVGGHDGWKVEYRDTTKMADRYIFEIYTIADGKFYVLKYVEDPLKVPETLPLANKMVESFQINIEEDMGSNSGVEGIGKNSTLEDYQNRCPPMSLVLCRPPPDVEEPQDDSNR